MSKNEKTKTKKTIIILGLRTSIKAKSRFNLDQQKQR